MAKIYGFTNLDNRIKFIRLQKSCFEKPSKYDIEYLKKIIQLNQSIMEYNILIIKRKIRREKKFIEHSKKDLICEDSYNKFMSSCSEHSICVNISEFNKHIGNIFKSNEKYYTRYHATIK